MIPSRLCINYPGIKLTGDKQRQLEIYREVFTSSAQLQNGSFAHSYKKSPPPPRDRAKEKYANL